MEITILKQLSWVGAICWNRGRLVIVKLGLTLLWVYCEF